jgi:hypothetical protein
MTNVAKTYNLTGQILEACSCKTPCPCWIGEAPDDGSCDSFVAYHVERGKILGCVAKIRAAQIYNTTQKSVRAARKTY